MNRKATPILLAVVILGGLFTSTLLNLLIVPSLYLRFSPSAHRARQESLQPAEEGRSSEV